MFISVEGPDGSGKTTQLTLLGEFLVRQGYDFCITREPGGTAIGEQIRNIVHDTKNDEMESRAEILLYSASRAQIVGEVIRPALAEGKIVLCDRFYDSTLAYQGYGRQLDLDSLRLITTFATGGLKPDMTLYFDVQPEEGLRRRQKDSAAEWNRLDAVGLEFHKRVHEGYRALIAEEPERWVVIDANRPAEVIQVQVQEIVVARLEKPL